MSFQRNSDFNVNRSFSRNHRADANIWVLGNQSFKTWTKERTREKKLNPVFDQSIQICFQWIWSLESIRLKMIDIWETGYKTESDGLHRLQRTSSRSNRKACWQPKQLGPGHSAPENHTRERKEASLAMRAKIFLSWKIFSYLIHVRGWRKKWFVFLVFIFYVSFLKIIKCPNMKLI